MNMTVVIMSKRSMEFVVLCGVLLLATAAAAASEQQDMPAEFETVGDERRQLDDEQLGSIVRDFGGHLKDTMEAEMEKLLSEVEAKTSSAQGKKSAEREVKAQQLAQLKEANREASQDIKARVELVGDNEGNLPQMSLGGMATSFAAAASGRLSSAGSYIGNKMRSLGNSVKAKIPAKLRRFFKWPTFLRFKIRFHKTYSSLRDELYRHMIFLRSHVLVGMQHLRFLLGRDKHLLGQNQYSDWTEKEYHDKEGNHEAERGPADLDASAQQALSAKQRAKLEELARSGINIFGQPVVASEKKSRKKRDLEEEEERAEGGSAKRQRRAKRGVDADGDEDMDELNDDELDESEDEDLDSMDLDNELDSEADANPEEAFKLVEEFAMDLDLSSLDDIENTLDEALNANDDFKRVDLRETGCMIKAENQNGCGCCYSYAIHAAASYYNCMEKKQDKPDRYHARFMADCGKYLTPEGKFPAVNGCRGGRISKGYAFTQMVGVQRFASYNIARVSAQVQDDTCVYPRPADLASHGWRANIEPVPMFQRSRFSLLKREEVNLHLRTVGPVAVNVRTWKNFKSYEAGILAGMEDAEKTVLHSMLIVGHDKDAKGRAYWIILNSHGIVFGENGYIRVYVDVLEDFAVLYAGLAPLDVE